MPLKFKDYHTKVETGHEVKAHLPHFCDLIYENGYNGALIAKEILYHLNECDIGVKADGSVGLFFGKHPKNNRFFIGTKSVLSKNDPKFIFSEKDINKHYPGDENLNFRKELNSLLENLKKINTHGRVYQSDVLFTSKSQQTFVSGVFPEAKIAVTPNTITYLFEDSISDKDVCIVIHDSFIPLRKDGNSIILSERSRKFPLKSTQSVEIINGMLENNLDSIDLTLESIDNSRNSDFLSVSNIYMEYKNSEYNDLDIFLKEYLQKEQDKRSSKHGKIGVLKKVTLLKTYLNEDWFKRYIKLADNLVTIKEELLYDLKECKNPLVRSCIITENDVINVDGEGYVLFYKNNQIKLVDKNSFTYWNKLNH
jgi:hypothetical protein